MANNDWITFARGRSVNWAAPRENRAFWICENKDADQLRSNADQRLWFRHEESTIPVKILSLYPLSVGVQPGLCQTWSETSKTGFLTTRLYLYTFFFFVLFCMILRTSAVDVLLGLFYYKCGYRLRRMCWHTGTECFLWQIGASVHSYGNRAVIVQPPHGNRTGYM